MATTERRLAALATGQHGFISRSDANAAGVTDRQLRSRIQSGSLVQVGPHTFRLFGAIGSARSALFGLLLDVGPEAFASGPTAAALHGFDGFALRAPFDVTIVRDRNVRRIGHRIHTTTELPPIDRAEAVGCPVLAPARALIDLARTIREDDTLRAALDSALRDGLVTEESLMRRITALRGSGRYGIPRLVRVVDGNSIVAGGHSWLEREFLRVVAAAGLPRPDTQQVLSRAGDRLVRCDFRFPGSRVVVEVMGYGFHRTREQLSRDAARLNALVRDGWLPFQFTYDQVVGDPAKVVAEVAGALRLPHAS